VGNLIAPKAPQEIAATGLEPHVLTDLMVKWGFTETRFTGSPTPSAWATT
jgi:hypothetical protein